MRGSVRPLGSIVAPLLLAGLTALADQATKRLVAAWLGADRGHHRFEILGRWVAVEYVENSGAAFGVLRGQGALLALVAIAVVVGLVVYYRQVTAPAAWLVAGLGLLLGGAVGNLLDRVRLGYVVDFIAVGLWPRFNLADCAITLGVLALAWQLTFGDGRSRDHQQREALGPPVASGHPEREPW